MIRHQLWRSLALGAAILLPTAASKLMAADIEFLVPSGDFDKGTAWVGSVAPGSNDRAIINNGGVAVINPGITISVNELQLGNADGTSGKLVMDGGKLFVTGSGNGTDDAFAIGTFGTAEFTLNAGDVELEPTPGGNDVDFHIGRNNAATMIMNGGTLRMGRTLRIGRETGGDGQFQLLGGEFYSGTGVVVARNQGARGEFVIAGTGTYVAGNSVAEGDESGHQDEGFFSVSNQVGAESTVVVRDNGVVKALRLTGRQGVSSITVEGSGRFLVDPTIGNGTDTGRGLWNTFLGGGVNSNGDNGGGNGGSTGDGTGVTGNYTLNIRDNGRVVIDGALPEGNERDELQGFILARGGATATVNIEGNGSLRVPQRLRIGGTGAGAELDGFNGGAFGGENPAGTATVNVSGKGSIVTDDLNVGASGVGTLDLSGQADVQTESLNAIFDPAAGGTRSINSVRIGFHDGSEGTVNVRDQAKLVAGDDLIIGHFGKGTLNQSGGTVTGVYTVLGNEVGSQGVYNLSGGLFDHAGGDLEIGDAGNGVVNHSGGTAYLQDSASVGNRQGQGFYRLSGNAVLDITKNANGGDLLVAVARNGNAAGTGELTITGGGAKVLVNNDVRFNPNDIAASATLVEEITGATQTTILARGSIDLTHGADALRVSLSNYLPFGNEVYRLLAANQDLTGLSQFGTGGAGKGGTVEGEFDEVDLTGAKLPDGMTWELSYTATEVLLSVKSTFLMGDANSDGKVDLTDFGVLKTNFGAGTTFDQGDFNKDAKVDLTDFGILKTHFGKSGVAVAAVPEPSSLVMCGAGMLALLALRRRNRPC